MRAKRTSAIMGPVSTLKRRDFSANVSLATVASFVKLTLMTANHLHAKEREVTVMTKVSGKCSIIQVIQNAFSQ